MFLPGLFGPVQPSGSLNLAIRAAISLPLSSSPVILPFFTVSYSTLQSRYSAYSEYREDKELSIILYSVCQSL